MHIHSHYASVARNQGVIFARVMMTRIKFSRPTATLHEMLILRVVRTSYRYYFVNAQMKALPLLKVVRQSDPQKYPPTYQDYHHVR